MKIILPRVVFLNDGDKNYESSQIRRHLKAINMALDITKAPEEWIESVPEAFPHCYVIYKRGFFPKHMTIRAPESPKSSPCCM